MLWIIDLILLAALWGASFLLMRLGATEFGALPTACLRVMIGGACLLPLVIRNDHSSYLKTRPWEFLLLGTFNSAIPFTRCTGYAALVGAVYRCHWYGNAGL
jgi:drug/metabolite transporter (DMT)-like permease